MTIRAAQAEDVPLLLEFVRKLAAYEKLLHEVVATDKRLHETLFGAKPYATALLAFAGGRPAGFAVYFFAYSTFMARPILYIEDIFVDEDLRGLGVGRELFRELIAAAEREGCGRMEWSVLDWNKSARDFYERVGAKWREPWLRYELGAADFARAAVRLRGH